MLAYYLWEEKNSPKERQQTCQFAIWVAEKMLQQFMLRVEPEDEQGKGGFLARAVYSALPPQFAREQLEAMLREFNLRSSIYNVISMWKKRGCIVADSRWDAKEFRKL